MKAHWKLLAVAGLVAGAGLASAAPIGQRGYGNCIEDIEDAYPRHAAVMHARYYYHEVGPEEMSYYINSTAWQNGDRVPLRTFCRTDRFGRNLLSRDTMVGRWIHAETDVQIQEVTSR